MTTSTVDITATASDNSGKVTQVEFYYHIDQRGTFGAAFAMDPPVLIGIDTSRPYEARMSLPKMCNAIVSIYVWAYDKCDNGGRSSTVQVNVCN